MLDNPAGKELLDYLTASELRSAGDATTGEQALKNAGRLEFLNELKQAAEKPKDVRIT